MTTLATVLNDSGVLWNIDIVSLKASNLRRNDLPPSLPKRIRVRLLDTRKIPPDSCTSLLIPSNPDLDMDTMLSTAMQANLPDHPAYLKWLRSRGHSPIIMNEDAMGDALGGCLQNALRLTTDSEQSCIQHGAITHLAATDWAHILEMLRDDIKDLCLKMKTRGAPLLRRDLGLVIKGVFTFQLHQVRDVHRETPRTTLESFALTALEAACKLTPEQDWIHVWTSFLCADVSRLATTQQRTTK